MLPPPPSFASLGEHLRDHHYEPLTLAKALHSYLQLPENRDALTQDELDEMHQRFQYREVIKDFILVLMPFFEIPEDWEE
ncbi:hypothetical protein [Runella salmonicolor]|uniref:Uncharacterized protein n=1 Tax=Runella salmonicolor TaxID=2950278 RepID=A0ABT1FRR6_9BACT|nr:hypothetical protein [Runella salmonicolor]MCP1384454.1 hypothetical protein [Runella salmonicolor]